jgi:phage-related minor tail protein
MALEASVLTVQVVSQGITDATKALNDLAAAGEKAEKGTSNIGKGAAAVGQAAKDAAKAGVDAAQQAASQYNAIIDMMTEKSNTYYSDKTMKAANAAQQELFDGMSMMDKLWAYSEDQAQKQAAQRAKESADIRAQQQAIMDAATARYAAEQDLANRMNATYDKKAQAAAQIAAMKQEEAEWKALAKAADEYYASERKLADEADKWMAKQSKAQEIAEANKLADANRALTAETAKLNAEYAREQSTANQMNKDVDAFVNTLKRQADTIGMSTKQLKEYNAEQQRQQAAQLGVSQQVEGFISKIQAAKGPHESFNLLTAGSARELMVLGHELSQGNFQRFGGSMIVLGERINFLPKLLESASTAASALGMSLGALIVTIAATAAVIVAGVITYNKSATALHEMKDAAILTGGAIGMTGDAMYDMSNRIGDSVGQFGKAREAILALANTGKFTADQIGQITEAAIGLEKYGGVSIEKTIAVFEKLATGPVGLVEKGFKGVSNAAMQLDEQLHFLDPTVLAHIVQLERVGDTASASKVAIQSLADEEKKRSDELKSELTPLGALMIEIAEKASQMWNAIFHKEGKEERLNQLQEALRSYDAHPIWSAFNDGITADVAEKMRAEAKALQDSIMQDQYSAEDKAHQVRINLLTNEQTIYMRNLADRAKGEETLQQRLATFDNVIAQQRAKAASDPAFAAANQQMLSEASVAQMREQIKRDSIRAAPKPKSDGLSGLDKTLADISTEYQARKHAWDDEIKLIDFMQQHKLISDTEAQRKKEDILVKEQDENKDALQKELDAIDAFHSKDTKLMEQAAAKRAKIAEQMGNLHSTMTLKKAENGLSGDIFDAEAQYKADNASQQVIATTVKQTEAIQAKIDAYNRLPESVRAAGVTEKQMQDQITQSEIDWYDEKIKSIALMGPESAKEVQRLTAERDALKEKTKAQKDWEDIQAKNSAALNQSAALTKIATEQVKMWKETGNEIEKALTSAFGNSGASAGKMFKVFADNQAQQVDIANQIHAVKANTAIDEQTKLKQTTDLQNQSAQLQIGMYGNMADAAAGFFDKQSTGYKIATSVSKAFHLAEMAMALASIPAKLAAGAATMFAQSGWGGFAGVAAMTAVVAAFGVAVTSRGGGPMSSADQQKVQGTGTVLGSPTDINGNKVELVGAKSDSIVHSLSIAEKNSGLGLVVQTDMLDAMRKLNDNIGAFAKLIVQDTSLTGTVAGKTTSPIEDFFNKGLIVDNKLTQLFTGFVGKVFGTVFGGAKTVEDTGLAMGKASIAQIAANGVSASQYTNTKTSGGWFSSDKYNTSLTSLGADTNDQFSKVILSMADTLKAAAKGLGEDSTTFNDKLQSFVVDIGNISLKGMTGDQIQQTLQNVFSKLGDQMAAFAFSDLQKYQKIGEGLMETVVRVANDLQQVKDVFDTLGKTIPTAMAGIEASEQLITQFGSVDNLTKGVKAYVSAIYTDQEKLDPVIASVNSAMAALNLTGIKTKEQFKSLVDGLDLTTTAGQQLFQELMNIAPQFGQMVDAAQKAAQDVASGLLTDVDNAFNGLSKIVTTQKDAITKAADDATAAAQTQLDAAKTQQTAIQTVFDSVTSSLSSLTSSTQDTVTQWKWAEAQATIVSATASAAAGNDISKMGGLQDALNTLSKPDSTRFSTAQEAAMSNAQAVNALTKLQGASKQQVDTAQLTIDKLNDTIKAIDDQKTAQLAALDSIISNAQDQIDSLKGQSSTLLSIDQGIKALNQAIAAARANPLAGGVEAINNAYQKDLGRPPDSAGMAYWQQQLANGVSPQDITKSIATSSEAQSQINALYQTLLNRNADQAGMSFWTDTLAKGGSLADISKGIMSSKEYSSIPSFDIGTNNLPHDMIAKVHKDEAIVPAADNSQIKQRLQDGNNASAELSGKVDELVTVIKSGDVANVNVQKELLKIIKRWDTDGQPDTRSVNGV